MRDTEDKVLVFTSLLVGNKTYLNKRVIISKRKSFTVIETVHRSGDSIRYDDRSDEIILELRADSGGDSSHRKSLPGGRESTCRGPEAATILE